MTEDERARKLQNAIEKVAQMVVYGSTPEAIMMACGISELDLERLQKLPEYHDKISELQTADFEQQQLISQGWDYLEQQSLAGLCKIIAYNRDPELLLRIAKTANTATRTHGKNGNRVIDPSQQGGTVIVNLGINFVDKLKDKQIPPRTTLDDADKKTIDCLGQQQVENFLGYSSRNEDERMIEEVVEEFA